MKKYRDIFLFILVEFLIIIIGIGLSVGIFTHVKNQNAARTLTELSTLETQFGGFLQDSINLYMYSNHITQNLNKIADITDMFWSDYIDFMDINSNPPLFSISNELKFIPLINNTYKEIFEDKASIMVNSNFTIYDVDFSNNFPVFIPAANRSFYCPLSYLAPNKTLELVEFLGVDLCNSAPWRSMFEALSLSNKAIRSRLVLRKILML